MVDRVTEAHLQAFPVLLSTSKLTLHSLLYNVHDHCAVCTVDKMLKRRRGGGGLGGRVQHTITAARAGIHV